MATRCSTVYSGLITVVTNPLLQTHSETRNSRGEIVGTKDNLNGITSYAYDPFGNLVQTTDPAGNISSMQYDLRGRKTAMTDPDMGHWTYSYDVLGQLVSQTDAKLQTTTFAYDLLGRMTGRVEPDLTSNWTYDSTTMGIGKLGSASASNGYSRTHSYDSLGRPSSTSLTVDGNTHVISQTYDVDGRVATVTYPSGFTIKYVNNWQGYLQEIRDNATDTMLWRAEARDAYFNFAQSRQGNNVVTNRAYDRGMNRLMSIQAGPGNAVQNDSYTWDTAGNVLTRSDATQGLTETFTYDGLNQVATAAIAGGPSKSFTYDAIGNITSKSDAGTYTYPTTGSARPHAVASIAGTVNAAYSYDANGNLTAGAGRSVSWTSFNMPATIQRGTSVLGYDYDTEHNRIRQADTSTTTLFFNDPASGLTVEKVVGSGGAVTWNNYVYVGGAIVVAFYEQPAGTNEWRYFHQDQLGSIEVITDQTGTVVERQGYDSWGKRRYPGGADDPTEAITSLTDRSYTGHAYLQEVGLIHMNGRVYDPVLGRFMSADPNVQSPTHTQSFNRYAYVMNNPLNATDPTGFEGDGDPSLSFSNVPNEFGYYDIYATINGTTFIIGATQAPNLFNRNPATSPSDLPIQGNPIANGGDLAKQIKGSGTTVAILSGSHSTSVTTSISEGIDQLSSSFPHNHNGSPPLDDPKPANKWLSWRYRPGIVTFFAIILDSSPAASPQELQWERDNSWRWAMQESLRSTAQSIPDNIAGSIRNVNPLRGTSNCVNCAIATDATLGGAPASALLGYPSNITAIGYNWISVSGEAEIRSILLRNGPGSRGVVFGDSPVYGEPGHVWNGINNGKSGVNFVDGQVGGNGRPNFDYFTNFQFLLTHSPK